jgi:hypothetical protein
MEPLVVHGIGTPDERKKRVREMIESRRSEQRTLHRAIRTSSAAASGSGSASPGR